MLLDEHYLAMGQEQDHISLESQVGTIGDQKFPKSDVLFQHHEQRSLDNRLNLDLSSIGSDPRPGFSVRSRGEQETRVSRVSPDSQKVDPVEYPPKYQVDMNAELRTITINGVRARLTQREYQLIEVLHAHRGRLASYSTLLQSVWQKPDSKKNHRLLLSCISNLRSRLTLSDLDPNLIKAVAGKGIIFLPDEETGIENLEAKSIELDESKQRVTQNGKPVELTPVEFQMLHLLMQNVGKTVSFESLYEAATGSRVGHSNQYIRFFIHQLRKKLGDDAKNPRYIETIKGKGYIMISDKDNITTVGNIKVDIEQRRVWVRGKIVHLSINATDLLIHMVKKQHKLLTYDEIAEILWGHKKVRDTDEISNIKYLIRSLRKALEPNRINPRYIHTIRKRGYIFEDKQSRSSKDRREYQIDCGIFSLDPVKQEILKGRKRISLTPKEYLLLNLLQHFRNKIISKEFILNQVWVEAEDMDPFYVKQYIYYLRTKLMDKEKRIIVTYPGEGYMLVIT